MRSYRQIKRVFQPIRLPLLAALALAPAAAFGQVVIVKQGAQKWPIDLQKLRGDGSPAAARFLRTLQKDLTLSGWFRVSPPRSSILRCTGMVRVRGRHLRVDCRLVSLRDGRQRLHSSFRAPAAEARRAAHRLADEIVETIAGRPGIARTRIAMVGTASGYKELYLCDYDGRNLIQLTHDRTISVAPNWAPDGQRLYYTSYLKGYPDIYTVDLVRGRRVRLVRFPGLNTGAAVSPDGTRLALVLSKDGNPELYIMDIRTRRLTRLTRTRLAAEASPAWSPDGERLAYVSDRSGTPQIYIWNAGEEHSMRLRLRGSENVAPDWSPGGKLAFASRFAGRYRIGIYDFRDGSVQYITPPDADYEEPSWAPDGRHLAVTRTTGYRSTVVILDTMGDSPRTLTPTRGDWYSPAWSPR